MRKQDVPPTRLLGFSFWFSEDNSFAFGLQVDLQAVSSEQMDRDALYARFLPRLLEEYRKLKIQANAGAHLDDAYTVDPEEDTPIGIQMSQDEVFFLQIVPPAIEPNALEKQLPEALRQFLALMCGGEGGGQDD